jgi:hypothetical protein
MPRPLRLEFENAWYHVMNRGAGKRNIFHGNVSIIDLTLFSGVDPCLSKESMS